MKTLLISPKSEHDYQFLSELLNKLGYDSQVVLDENMEDLGLLKAMVEERKGDYVPEEDIMKSLGRYED